MTLRRESASRRLQNVTLGEVLGVTRGVDVVNFAVGGRNQERLVDAGHDAAPGELTLSDDGERRMHLVAVRS